MRQVNLVDDQDKVIGHMSLLEAHKGGGKKHQAVSLFLFHCDQNGHFKLLLQQRSDQKIVGKKQWANTLCANLSPKEDHLSCLKRRALEELGIRWQNNWSMTKIMVFDYQVECEKGYSENEIDHLFVTVLNDQELKKLLIKPNIDEVNDYLWLDWAKIKAGDFEEMKLTPWFALFMKNQEIIKNIDKALNSCQK